MRLEPWTRHHVNARMCAAAFRLYNLILRLVDGLLSISSSEELVCECGLVESHVHRFRYLRVDKLIDMVFTLTRALCHDCDPSVYCKSFCLSRHLTDFTFLALKHVCLVSGKARFGIDRNTHMGHVIDLEQRNYLQRHSAW